MSAIARHYRIKAAQAELIALNGGIMRVAEAVSYGKSEVGRWNNAADPDIIPLAVALQLEAACGMPLVTAAMAELNGRRLADPQEQVSTGSVLAHHADAVQQAAELMAVGAAAFADGRLTPAEAQQMDRAAGALERNVSELRKALAATRGQGGFSVVGGGAA